MFISYRLIFNPFRHRNFHVLRFLGNARKPLTISSVAFTSKAIVVGMEHDDLHNHDSKFLYFAFGSNLLEERLHLSCPSAVRLSAAKLSGYSLTFNYNSLRWRGHAATIKEADHGATWGCIWSINKDELEKLHRQEGVHQGLYRPLDVEVTTPEGITLTTMTYQMTLPYEEDAKPSVVYKSVIIQGAMDGGLPADYIEGLKKVPDNGYDGPVDVKCSFAYRQDAAAPQTHIKCNIDQVSVEADFRRRLSSGSVETDFRRRLSSGTVRTH